MQITINNQSVECQDGMTIIMAAEQVGIEIPTMCYLRGSEPNSSCMVCMVYDEKSQRMFPACSHPVAPGMSIVTENEKVFEFRRATLEMLLSEHIGDCEAPCQRVCPAHLDIPQMIRFILEDKWTEAWGLIDKDLVYPSILCRLCHAPCEGGCRRNHLDETIAISNLVQTVSDWRLKQQFHDRVPVEVLESPLQEELHCDGEPDGKREHKVAIVGCGPGGLAAASALLSLGLNVEVFVRGEKPGGTLHKLAQQGELPAWILDLEVEQLKTRGVQFHYNSGVSSESELQKLQDQCDAVILAMGQDTDSTIAEFGFAKGLKPDRKNFMTEKKGVFVCGGLFQKDKKIIQVAVQAQQCAWMVSRFVQKEEMVLPEPMYNSVIGRLKEGEVQVFAQNSWLGKSTLKTELPSHEAVKTEADRCMHCDCRAKDDCKLREYSDRYQVRKNKFSPDDRMAFEQESQHGEVIFEPGKCVKCGICVDVSSQNCEPLGLAFVGRGYDMRTGIALKKDFQQGLIHAAKAVIEACPTGSLGQNDKPGKRGKNELESHRE